MVKGAAGAAGLGKLSDIQKENPAAAGGGNIHHKGLPRQQCVGFRKNLTAFSLVQDASVSPDIIGFYQDSALQNHSQGVHHISCVKDYLIFLIAFFICLEAGKQGISFFLVDASKECGIGQKGIFHFFSVFVV